MTACFHRLKIGWLFIGERNKNSGTKSSRKSYRAATNFFLLTDKNQFSNKQIKVGGTTRVEPVSIEYKDKDYTLKTYPDNKASSTGHVVIAELFSNDDGLPKFIFRWDHGVAVMDIDILLDDKDSKGLWKQNGYQGHWTRLTDDEKREYSVSIEIPGRKIFEGIIGVGLLTELNLHDGITLGESVDVKII